MVVQKEAPILTLVVFLETLYNKKGEQFFWRKLLMFGLF